MLVKITTYKKSGLKEDDSAVIAGTSVVTVLSWVLDMTCCGPLFYPLYFVMLDWAWPDVSL